MTIPLTQISTVDTLEKYQNLLIQIFSQADPGSFSKGRVLKKQILELQGLSLVTFVICVNMLLPVPVFG